MLSAKGMTFGLVSKSMDDLNFVAAWHGCQDAAKIMGDHCIHIGAEGAAHPRSQAHALEKAMKIEKFDALAISVTNSKHIANTIKKLTIPIITFDSPFDEQHSFISKAYVGMKNKDVGRDIAKIAKYMYPKGGSVCLMTAAHDPNLKQRLIAVRQELSGDPHYQGNNKLSGENGWKECARSPWNTADDITRTMGEVTYTLNIIKPDVLIAVGHWPVVDIAKYRKSVKPYSQQLISGQTKILIGGIGDIDGVDQLIHDNLIHAYVKINFYEIGRKSYDAMHALVTEKPFKHAFFVPNTIKTVPPKKNHLNN